MQLMTTTLLKVVGVALAFFINLTITKSFSIDDAGSIFYFLSICLILQPVISCGLYSTITRRVAISDNSENISLLFYSALVMTVSVIVIMFFLIITLKIFNIIDSIEIYFLIILYCFFYVVYTILAHFFQGKGLVVKAMIIINVIQNVFLLVFTNVYSIYTVRGMIWLYVFAAIFCMIISISLFRNEFGNIKCVIKFKFINDLFIDSLPILLSTIISVLISYMSIYVLGFFATTEEVAIFSVSLKLAILINFVLQVLNRIYSSKIAIYNDDYLGLQKVVTELTRTLFLFSFPASLVVFIFSENLLNIFGAEYISGSLVLKVLCIGQFIIGCTGGVGTILNMTGYQNEFLKCSIISLFVSFLSSIILINIYGVMGGAISMSLSIITLNICASYKIWTKLNVNVIKLW